MTVAAYFELWRAYMTPGSVIKAERVRRLQEQIPARNRSAIEFKFRNISSVVQARTDEYLAGYRPLPNIQGSLRQAVDLYLTRNGEFVALLEARGANIIPGPTDDTAATEDVLVDAPGPRQRKQEQGPIVTGRFAAYDEARRRDIGRAGEQWVIDRERRSLERAGRPRLADQIRWVAKEDGDGLGYDVASFRPDGTERMIEVKTTNRGISTPFFITQNEVETSGRLGAIYSLYRVFDFGVRPRLYQLDGAIDLKADLTPWVYIGEPAAPP